MIRFTPPPMASLPEQLETVRLILRPPKMGDGKIINDAIRETFPALHRWMAWAKHMPSIAESETIAREANGRWRAREELQFWMFNKTDGMVVGSSGLHHIDWDVPKFEIGYWVRASCEGYGYVTESVNALTQFCLTELKAERIEIRCDARNTRSSAVAVRAGYSLEATLHKDRRDTQGEITDTLIFCKLSA